MKTDSVTTEEYNRGYLDGTEDAAQKLTDIYNKLRTSCDNSLKELTAGNKMICDIVLGILAPIQSEIRKLEP